jgi:hypothetical protein
MSKPTTQTFKPWSAAVRARFKVSDVFKNAALSDKNRRRDWTIAGFLKNPKFEPMKAEIGRVERFFSISQAQSSAACESVEVGPERSKKIF